MKQLIITRHAKSSWDDPSLDDIDRPLNKRGQKAAPKIGRALKERNILPEAIHISPSVRTRLTAGLICGEIGFAPAEIEIIPAFYGTSVHEMIHHLAAQSQHSIMVIGHNPCWTDLCNRLTDINLANLPTAGTLIIDFPIDSWDQLPAFLSASRQSEARHTLLLPRQL